MRNLQAVGLFLIILGTTQPVFAYNFVPQEITRLRCDKLPTALCFLRDHSGFLYVGLDISLVDIPIGGTVATTDKGGDRFVQSVGTTLSGNIQTSGQLGLRVMLLGDWISVGVGVKITAGLSKDIQIGFRGADADDANGIRDQQKLFGPSALSVSPIAFSVGFINGLITFTFQRYSIVNDDKRIVGFSESGARFEIAPRADVGSGWLIGFGVSPSSLVQSIIAGTK